MATGKKIGRPLKHAPADAAKRIEKTSAAGASIIGIAASLGVGKRYSTAG